MAIPLYAAQAAGAHIIALDDQGVFKDLTLLDGSGGNDYQADMLSATLSTADVGGYAKIRRWKQRVIHDGAVSIEMTPWRDGNDSNQMITRTLAVGDNPTLIAALDTAGSTFQFKIVARAFDAAAFIGAGEYTVIPRRAQR